jgi:hypothetical protein
MGSRYQYDGTRNAIRYIEPWYHSDFAPLPRTVLQGIRTINPSEMPVRHDYDKALWKFLTDLPPELREVSAFAPDVYTGLAQAIEKGDTSTLSERVKSWVVHHHVRTGSRNYRLLLLPREQYFAIRPETEEKLRNEFIAEVDGDVFPASLRPQVVKASNPFGRALLHSSGCRYRRKYMIPWFMPIRTTRLLRPLLRR